VNYASLVIELNGKPHYFLQILVQILRKAELWQSFSMCIYCMRLRFQSNKLALAQTSVITLKMRQYAVIAR